MEQQQQPGGGGRLRGGRGFASRSYDANNTTERGSGGGRNGRGWGGRYHSSDGSANYGRQGRGYSLGRGDGRGGFDGRQYNPNRFHRGGGGGRGRGGFWNSNNNRNYSNDNRKRRDDADSTSFNVIEEIGVRPSDRTISIAIEGCCHGELDRIYDRIANHENATGQKIDLLLCCGDFQSLRNESDYHSLAVPPKYRSIGTFHQYYSEQKVAPVLTIFIGGNHEASQPLHELYYGGWVAPNIYYLGAAGVVNYNGIRIGGISGIYKSHDYNIGRYEKPPYDKSSLRSIYHVRNVDVYRLKCLSSLGSNDLAENKKMDIMISHDWPLGIEQYGDTAGLVRRKPFFRKEIQENNLGSPPNRELLDVLQPKYWFAAHLHVKFKASVHHNRTSNSDEKIATPSETAIGHLVPSQVIGSKLKETSDRNDKEEIDEVINNEASVPKTDFIAIESSDVTCTEDDTPDLTTLMTQFLSLDKCLPRREYLSILHVPVRNNAENSNLVHLEYDPEWLVVLQKTHTMQSTERRRIDIPSNDDGGIMNVTREDLQNIQSLFGGSFVIPNNFRQTVPPYTNDVPMSSKPPNNNSYRIPPPCPMMGNPQTDEFLAKLQLDHILTIPWVENVNCAVTASSINNEIAAVVNCDDAGIIKDDNEIDIDDEENSETNDTESQSHDRGAIPPSHEEYAPNAGATDSAIIDMHHKNTNDETEADANKKPRLSDG